MLVRRRPSEEEAWRRRRAGTHPPKTKSDEPCTTHVCAQRGAGAADVAGIASHRDVSKLNECRSLNGERPDLPPKAYIVEPCTTAVCPPRGDGGTPDTRTCAHSDVARLNRKVSLSERPPS